MALVFVWYGATREIFLEHVFACLSNQCVKKSSLPHQPKRQSKNKDLKKRSHSHATLLLKETHSHMYTNFVSSKLPGTEVFKFVIYKDLKLNVNLKL